MRWAGHCSLALLFSWWGVQRTLVSAYEEKVPDEDFADDNSLNVAQVRERLAAGDNATLGGKYGVVLVVGPSDESFSQLTIPLWREYCKKHGMGFWLQKEPLNTDFPFMWSKPRLLLELLPVVKWRYLMVVDANTLPKNFGKSWEYLIKFHMRHKRWNNDEPNARHIFCPWECDDGYTSPYEDGACSGPVSSVCIYWSQKPKTHRLVKSWYSKRRDPDIPSGEDGVTKGFDAMKSANWEQVFYRDVPDELGRPNSKFIPAFGWSEEYQWNLRDRIHNYIKKDPKLAEIANEAAKAAESAKAAAKAAESARAAAKAADSAEL